MAGVFAILAIILAVVLFGSLVPQGLSPEVYLERYGVGAGRIFLALGLDDVFRTRGFACVGVILFFQLIACTWRRLLLLRGQIRLWAVGSVLLHIGLMIFLASIGVSLWQGRIIMIEAVEGKTLELANERFPFDLRLDKFTVERYADQQAVKQYRSEVSLMKNGQLLKQGSLEVNEPLNFNGVKIYQMSYGWCVEGEVRRLPDGPQETFSVQNGEWIHWSGEALEPIRIAIMTDPDRMNAIRPTVAFIIAPSSGIRRSGILAAGETVVSGGVEIRFERLRRSSGLQLKEDPGISGIFGGLVLALIGLGLRYVPAGREKV